MALTPEQEQALASVEQSFAVDQSAEPQKGRSLAQGLTLGFADELEAFARSAVDERPYEEIRDEIRQKLREYQAQNPGEAITMELLGGLAPTAVAYLVGGPVGGGAQTASLLQKAKPLMKIGAIEGGLASYGTGEEGMVEDIKRVPFGATMGTVMSGLTTPFTHYGGTLADKVISKGRELFGDKGSDVVMREVQRLADSTGRTPEEVVDAIARGEIMAENKTLEASIRAMKAEQGEAGAKISEALPRRRAETREQAMTTLQEGLAPGTGRDNVFKAVQLSDKEARKQERKLYENVFTDSKELGSDIVDTLSESLQRLPNAKEVLDEIYKARGSLVPFYKMDESGLMHIVRMPNLEDAEIVRRALAETTSSAYKGGKGALGEALGDVEGRLRNQLDAFSPTLQATRQNAKVIRQARDAFKIGRGALGKNLDEIAFEFEKMSKKPSLENDAIIRSFRAGVMDSLRNASRRRPGLFQKMAEEGTQENELLRIAFPDDKIDDAIEKVRIAGQSQQAYQRIMFGSPTAPQEKASQLIGTGGRIARAQAGDPMAQIEMASDLIAKLRPGLTPQQSSQVADIVLSQDPNVVRRALIDDTAMAKLQSMVASLFDITGKGVAGTTAIQAGEQGGDIGQGLINLFGQ